MPEVGTTLLVRGVGDATGLSADPGLLIVYSRNVLRSLAGNSHKAC